MSASPSLLPSNVRAFPRERASDAELVAAVARGEPDAVAVVWRRYAKVVRATLYASMGPDSALDDLVQDIFIGFLRTAGTIQNPAALKAYLLGAAVRRAILERRTRARRSNWMSLFQFGSEARRAQSPVVEERDSLRALTRLLERLGDRERMAFVLRYVDDLPPDQVAEVLGVSEATAKRAIAKGRERVLLLASREPALAEYLDTLEGGSP